MIAYLDLSLLIIRKTTRRYFYFIYIIGLYPLAFPSMCTTMGIKSFFFRNALQVKADIVSRDRFPGAHTWTHWRGDYYTVSRRVRQCVKNYTRKCVLNAIYEQGFSTSSYGFAGPRARRPFFPFRSISVLFNY